MCISVFHRFPLKNLEKAEKKNALEMLEGIATLGNPT